MSDNGKQISSDTDSQSTEILLVTGIFKFSTVVISSRSKSTVDREGKIVRQLLARLIAWH